MTHPFQVTMNEIRTMQVTQTFTGVSQLVDLEGEQ